MLTPNNNPEITIRNTINQIINSLTFLFCINIIFKYITINSILYSFRTINNYWKGTAMNNDRLIKQFIEMLKVDSESGNERKIADYLKKYFKKFDVEVMEDDTTETTGHGA